jgi:two-component sensor histidine kinase
VLLKEIHHRVKNNMQIISSLLSLQSRSIEDEKSLAIFKKGRDRIRSMALIHEKLYQSKDLARIDFARYIQDLTSHLLQSYRVDSHIIEVKTDVEDVSLDINTAIPCGLIINELVSNSFKHAFAEGSDSGESSDSKNEISIGLHADNDKQLVLTVKDNGSGLPEDLDLQNTESLGLRLVYDLVEQLGGSIELQRIPGTTYKITFRTQK